MEAGDVIIIDKPKRKSPTPKKKEGEERTIVIYKIEIIGTNFLYVGHTESYKQRVDNHRTACKANTDPNSRSQNKNCPLYVEINKNGGWSKVTMTPVEEFVSKNKVQSRIREQYWIDKIQVARKDAVMMNGCPAYSSPEQKANQLAIVKAKYRKEHPEVVKAYSVKYHEENREELNAKCLALNSKKMTCPCGAEHRAGGKSKHLKSAKHIAWERDIDQKFVDRLENEMNELIENNVV
jgi:hypothetical protein